MAQLLGRMERDGLIERVPDQRDGRIRWIKLTTAAEAKLAEAHSIMMSANDEALATFTAEEIGIFEGYLQRLSDALDQLSTSAGA